MMDSLLVQCGVAPMAAGDRSWRTPPSTLRTDRSVAFTRGRAMNPVMRSAIPSGTESIPELGGLGGRSTEVFVRSRTIDRGWRRLMTPSEVSSLRAEALFASALQRSDDPTPTQVRDAVSASLRCHGPLGCAARVAEEFGEHPTEAVGRMSWVLAELRSAYPQTRPRRPPATAHCGHHSTSDHISSHPRIS